MFFEESFFMSGKVFLKSPKVEYDFSLEVATLNHDLSKIAAVINAAYKKVPYLESGVDRITSDELSSIIANAQKKLYLCLSPSRKICGTLLLDSSESKAEIGLFAIDPEYQGLQIGAPFMNYVEQEAFKKSSSIVLKVIPLFQEKLIKFYERLGYHRTDQIMRFPQKDKIRQIRPEYRERVFFSLMEKRQFIQSAL